MQTFLPYLTFTRCAKCLDYKRLGKQRLECLQILRTLNGETRGWQTHPAVLMWDGYTEALVEYGVACCDEWKRRGYQDNLRDRIRTYSEGWDIEPVRPPWLTHRFCLAHRSNLIRKAPDYYRPLWPNILDNLPYIWPVRINWTIEQCALPEDFS